MIEKTLKIPLKVVLNGIKIDYAQIYALKIPLTEPFNVANFNQVEYRAVIVELHSKDYVGYGEGATSPDVTGETILSEFENTKFILSALAGKNYDSIEDLITQMNRILYSNTTAKTAIDMAVHDIYCKDLGIHITKLVGGAIKPMLTSYTVSIESLKDSLREVLEFQKLGIKLIKVKVGTDINSDIEKVRLISENLKGEKFFVDANQGYSISDAVRMGKVLEETNALFFEQPLGRENLTALKELRKKISIPIMLDESISSPNSVINAILTEAADLINIKLVKAGGVRNAFKALSVAQAYGIDTMVGCMVESKLGVSAALAVASSLSNVKYNDLDGNITIKRQPFEKGFTFEKGANTAMAGYGMAVDKEMKNWK